MNKGLKNKVLPAVPIEKMAATGQCIARNNGQVIFIPGVAPGDVVDLKITGKKKKMLEAVPVKFHQYSENRVSPFCEHFGVCGGCKWQHIPYELQLQHKQQEVLDNLERIGKIPLPAINSILPSGETRYYRNKLEFTFSANRWLTREEMESGGEFDKRALGFHKPKGFDKVLAIQNCYLQPDPSNAIRLAVDAYAKSHKLPYYDIVNHQGLLRNLIIRTANTTGEVMVILQISGEANDPENHKQVSYLLEYIQAQFPEVTSLQYVINPKKNDAYQDLEVKLYRGNSYIMECLNGKYFKIGPKSFFQTNSKQAVVLYEKVKEMAALSGNETLVDLYTGTGTIANYLADQVSKVFGMELIEEAITYARENARINGIENAEFLVGDIRELLTQGGIQEHKVPDVVVTDPPRAGMHEEVIRKLLEVMPQKIIYISCNPATQARDAALLHEKYAVKEIQPVDMFPHTQHVENILLLELQ